MKIENIDQYIDEVVQRCIELTKMMFIGSMSAMEFGVREVIKLFPNHEIYESIERKEKLSHAFDKVFDTLNNESKDKLRKFRKKFKNVPIFDSFQYIINKSILTIITARKGSKRLKGKNLLNLGDKPLVAWTIEEAVKSKYIDQIIISTDDEKIIELAKKYNSDFDGTVS